MKKTHPQRQRFFSKNRIGNRNEKLKPNTKWFCGMNSIGFNRTNYERFGTFWNKMIEINQKRDGISLKRIDWKQMECVEQIHWIRFLVSLHRDLNGMKRFDMVWKKIFDRNSKIEIAKTKKIKTFVSLFENFKTKISFLSSNAMQ